MTIAREQIQVQLLMFCSVINLKKAQ